MLYTIIIIRKLIQISFLNQLNENKRLEIMLTNAKSNIRWEW